MISQKRTLEILSKAKYGDTASRIFDISLSFLILANLAAVCLESVESINNNFHQYFLFFEYISVIIFTVEYFLRIWVQAINEDSPAKSTVMRRIRYIFSFTWIFNFFNCLR